MRQYQQIESLLSSGEARFGDDKRNKTLERRLKYLENFIKPTDAEQNAIARGLTPGTPQYRQFIESATDSRPNEVRLFDERERNPRFDQQQRYQQASPEYKKFIDSQSNPQFEEYRREREQTPEYRQKYAAALKLTGDAALATGFASGALQAHRNPVNNELQVINVLDGSIVFRQRGGTGAGTGGGTEDGSPAKPNTTLWNSIDSATGAVNTLKELSTDTLGQVPGVRRMLAFPEVVAARQRFSTSTNDLIRALSINPRFPVSEMDRITREIAINPNAFTSDVSLRERMKEVDTYLKSRLQNEENTARNESLPVEDRRNASSAANSIRNFVEMMGVPRTSTPVSGPVALPSGRSVPPHDVQMLRARPTPEMRRMFDIEYGAGASDIITREGR
tara:strand:- start:686 stop:1861 length:1176 start_codon:yes stop_codon:yes gene_type:complete